MESVIIICSTFLLVLIAYWIMPIKKMRAVNGELKSLIQILPISQTFKFFKNNNKEKQDKDP